MDLVPTASDELHSEKLDDRRRVGFWTRAWQLITRHRRVLIALEIVAVVVVLASFGFAVRNDLGDSWAQLENANLAYVAAAFAAVAAYYLVFIVGWIRILGAWGIDVQYPTALRAEMISMLAKYVPGGVWMPAARTVALRRTAGVTNTPVVLASILVEAALSALSGIVVFVVSLHWVPGVDAPLSGLVALAVFCALILHPRIFRHVTTRLPSRWGLGDIQPLPFGTTLALLAYYCATWVVGGISLFFFLRSLGSDVSWTMIPYLGGTAAVAAIIATVAAFVPSGLGFREASMYALLLALAPAGPALGATLLSRLAITVVEVVLFAIGALPIYGRRDRAAASSRS